MKNPTTEIVIFENSYLTNRNRSRPKFFTDVLECYELHFSLRKLEIDWCWKEPFDSQTECHKNYPTTSRGICSSRTNLWWKWFWGDTKSRGWNLPGRAAQWLQLTTFGKWVMWHTHSWKNDLLLQSDLMSFNEHKHYSTLHEKSIDHSYQNSFGEMNEVKDIKMKTHLQNRRERSVKKPLIRADLLRILARWISQT